MDKEPIVRRKQNRSQRLANRFKGVLRCEWCNRWTEIPMKRWQKMRKDEVLFPCKYEFFCLRPRCRSERLEIMGEATLPS